MAVLKKPPPWRITSHYALSAEERQQRGISDGLLRLSVGLENAEDLIHDLQQALARVFG